MIKRGVSPRRRPLAPIGMCLQAGVSRSYIRGPMPLQQRTRTAYVGPHLSLWRDQNSPYEITDPQLLFGP